MNPILMVLGVLAGLAGFACSIWILIEAFKDELWKGFVGLLCGFYLLYFAVVDWDHDWKWPIILGSIGGNAVAAGIFRLAGAG